MASIAFHSRVVFPNVLHRRNHKDHSERYRICKRIGSVIKLLGVAHNTESGIEVGVYPMMIHKDHPLGNCQRFL